MLYSTYSLNPSANDIGSLNFAVHSDKDSWAGNSSDSEERMNAQENQLTDDQKKRIDTIMGVLAGLVVSIIAAILYALYPFIFGVQLSLLAMGVGFLIGFAINLFGKGKKRFLGIVGALFALVSCISGDVISAVAIYSFRHHAPFFELLGRLNFFSIFDILSQTTGFISIMFYGMAMIIAYAVSTMPSLPSIPSNKDSGLNPN